MTDKKNRGIASFTVSAVGSPAASPPAGEKASTSSEALLPDDEEGSLRILVVSELAPRGDYSTSPTPPLEPLPADLDRFDNLMQALSLSLAIDLPDPADPRGPAVRVDLRLDEFKAFRPGTLIPQVPVLKCWPDAVRVLRQVEQGQLSVEAATEQLRRILPRPAWADAVTEALRAKVAPPRPAEPAAPASPAPRRGADREDRESRLDSLLAQVALPGEDHSAKTPEVAPPVRAMVSAVARTAVSRRSTPTDVSAAIDLAESLAEKLVRSVISHPEFRRLERSWRGLRLLLEHARPRSNVIVEVFAVPDGQVEEVLALLARPNHFAGTSRPDLIVVDQQVDASARSLQSLERWGEAAGLLQAPVVTGGGAELAGVSSLPELGRSRSRLSSSDDPRAVAARNIAARDCARWLCIALNGPVARDAYTKETARVREIRFAEDPHAPPFFLNPAFVVGAIVAQAFARRGHPFACLGPNDGAVSGLPLRVVERDVAIPLEAMVALDAQAEVARCGLTLLGGPRNRDTVIMAHAPMLYRGESVARGGDSPPELTLPDQLLVSRIAHAVEQIAEALPPGVDSAAASEVSRLVLAGLFPGAGKHVPEIRAQVSGRRLEVVILPHRFGNITLGEIAFAANLG